MKATETRSITITGTWEEWDRISIAITNVTKAHGVIPPHADILEALRQVILDVL